MVFFSLGQHVYKQKENKKINYLSLYFVGHINSNKKNSITDNLVIYQSVLLGLIRFFFFLLDNMLTSTTKRRRLTIYPSNKKIYQMNQWVLLLYDHYSVLVLLSLILSFQSQHVPTLLITCIQDALLPLCHLFCSILCTESSYKKKKITSFITIKPE